MLTATLPIRSSRRRQPLVSAKQKILILFFLVLFSSVSGFAENTIYSISGARSAVFARNTVIQKNPTEKTKSSQAKVTHPSQFQVVWINEQKFIAPTIIPVDKPSDWGVAQQIDEHTWTVRLENDSKMGTAQEILYALNVYRQRHGKGSVAWDSKLADYAQKRAEGFSSQGTLDGHKGFMDFVNNQDGFNVLGFAGLGENSSIGYTMESVHLIEWVYAADKPHNDNQLSPDWSHVGIGVSGTATNLVFGGKKL